MTKEQREFKAKKLRLMDEFINEVVGDEDITEEWLAYGIPDDTTDYTEYVEEEYYHDIVDAFNNILNYNDLEEEYSNFLIEKGEKTK